MIALARTAVDRAQDQLKYARARLDRNKQLADSGVLTRTELEDTQEAAAVAERDLAEARHKLEVLQRGARPEEIAATRAEISGLEGQRRYLEGQLQRAVVRSPAAGVVATPTRQLQTAPASARLRAQKGEATLRASTPSSRNKSFEKGWPCAPALQKRSRHHRRLREYGP